MLTQELDVFLYGILTGMPLYLVAGYVYGYCKAQQDTLRAVWHERGAGATVEDDSPREHRGQE